MDFKLHEIQAVKPAAGGPRSAPLIVVLVN